MNQQTAKAHPVLICMVFHVSKTNTQQFECRKHKKNTKQNNT